MMQDWQAAQGGWDVLRRKGDKAAAEKKMNLLPLLR
jgi:hypothetical protein